MAFNNHGTFSHAYTMRPFTKEAPRAAFFVVKTPTGFDFIGQIVQRPDQLWKCDHKHQNRWDATDCAADYLKAHPAQFPR